MKYLDYKKDANPNVHVRVFNATVRANGETSKEYIINAFSYTLKKMALDLCHNYMLDFPNYIYLKLTHTFCKCHQKIENDEQIYMEFKHIEQKEIECLRCILSAYKSWLMDCKHQPQTIF